MAYLLDTGILLRLVNKNDAHYALVRNAVGVLGNRAEQLFTSTQNVAEFCNVATRPIANNGLGLVPSVAISLLQHEVEPTCLVLAEPDGIYAELKRLVAKYAVVGKQIHDARLAAMMLAWQIENILTLNEADFRRYEPEGITIVTPMSLAGSS